ncbi:hypothetical protein [Methanoculleus chikugoensis]|uniref:hypothetical protein n=1 Tax=Methanoculleus chikugoensis TaxID=118126 RepID=UPI000A93DC2B|nr:hypothetical protein [Methanoculleus chikugoensis]
MKPGSSLTTSNRSQERKIDEDPPRLHSGLHPPPDPPLEAPQHLRGTRGTARGSRPPHFHVSRGKERGTHLHVHEATRFAVESPFLHYTLNAPPHHYRVISEIIRGHDIDVVVGAHVLAGTAMVRAAKKYGVPVVFDLKDWFPPDSAAAYYKNPPP